MEVGLGADGWWAGRRVFVTGCTGLLGSWLSRALCDRGARLLGLSPEDPPADGAFRRFNLADRMALVKGEVTDADLLARAVSGHGTEYVFHLAAQSQVPAAQRDPAATFEINVRGTWLVLEAARRASPPPAVILASSMAVYGDRGDQPHEEDEALATRWSPYAASKACAELIGQSYGRTVGLPVCAARCSNLYGGGDTNPDRIVPGTIRSAMRGEAPVIRGDGRVQRDYLYVEDAVSGYLALAEKMERPGIAGQIFNFGSGRAVNVLDLVERILCVIGRGDLRPKVLGASSDDSQVTRVSAVKARDLLGWTAKVPLEAGLKATMDWYLAATTANSVTDPR